MSELFDILIPETRPDTFIEEIRKSPTASLVLEHVRSVVPDLSSIPQTTYSLYREFEYTGLRDRFQRVYFMKRAQLTRAVFELVMGYEQICEASTIDLIQDLLWSICEETTWVVPAHEEQGPEFWDLHLSPRNAPWGSHTALTREPSSIDLFAAETGASLAETIYLIGDQLAPEVRQRVRQEVERHIFKPYIAYGRQHWWFKGALNWNGVCNGSIGLAFLRLEKNPTILREAIGMVLEGFEAYIAAGFEADGGSIEGPSYWNYGMLYFVTVAEHLRERTGGAIDLLATQRMKDIARYPLGMALAPGTYINFGDAPEVDTLRPGIVQRLAERTGVDDLRGLILELGKLGASQYAIAKLAITLRDAAWWDGEVRPFPKTARQDFYLPDCGVAKFIGQTLQGYPVALAAKAGHNDGHHSHTDVGMLIYHVNGISLLCDPGRGLYSREYFRQERYENIFNNAIGHSVPVIGGKLQSPGPEFNGREQYHGSIVDLGKDNDDKHVVIDFHHAYDLPGLKLARRALNLKLSSGELLLDDEFQFEDAPNHVVEAFVTWSQVSLAGDTANLTTDRVSIRLEILEPDGVVFRLIDLEEECRRNQRTGALKRLEITLPVGSMHFRMKVTPEVNQ